MATEGGQIGFADEPEIHEVSYETPEIRPVEMRNKKKNDPSYKGPRISLVSRVPDTPRDSTLYVQKPTFWSHFDLSAHMAERTVNPLAWVVLVFVILGIFIIIITMVAPGWALTLEVRAQESWFEGEMHGKYGLWYACWSLVESNAYTRTSCELMVDLKRVPAWFNGVQGLGGLSIFLAAGCIGSTLMYICSKRMNEKYSLFTGVGWLCFITGFCIFIQAGVFCGLFLYHAKWCCDQQAMIVEWKLHYCFILACGNIIVYWAAAITAWMEVRRVKFEIKEENYLMRINEARGKLHPMY